MNIINAYEYFFYKLYRWSIKVNGEEYYNKYSASIMVSVVLVLNVFTALVIIDVLMNIEMPEIPKAVGVVIALTCGILNYFYFSSNDRCLRILNRYKNESIMNKKRGDLLAAIYVIGSLVLLIASGFFGSYINQLRQGM